MKRIRVVCESGLPSDAKILDADTGEEITNVGVLDIHMEPTRPVTATLTLLDVQADVTAEVAGTTVRYNWRHQRRSHWLV